MFSEDNFLLICIVSDFLRRRVTDRRTERRVNSFRREEVLTNTRSWSVAVAAQAAMGQAFDFDNPLAAAVTLSVYHEVAPQSLSWRPVTRCAENMRKALPADRDGPFLRAANPVGRKGGGHDEVAEKIPTFESGAEEW